MRTRLLLVCLSLAGLSLLARADDAETRAGAAAYGDWRTDSPGVRRKITPADLPAFGASRVTANPSRIVARPAGASPKAPPGFVVSEFASGLDEPRVVRVAPNGDIFVAESAAGRVSVLRAADGAPKAGESHVFASGLNRPYGIAFYPPGPDPRYVYVAATDKVVRYPYGNGDAKASGPAETIVPSLPTGHHWTRDVAFSPDGKTMFVAVGSGSNIAEDMPPLPEGQLAAFVASHARGATWGAEENRADVLAFDPDGGDMRVFATGIRNCSGLAVQPETSRAVVRRQRARYARRRPAARLRHQRQAGRLLRLAMVLHRRPRGPAPRGAAHRSRRRGDRARRAGPAPFRAARHRLLHGPRSSRPNIAATPSSRCTARGTAPSAPATRSCGCRSRTASRPANTRISSPASSPTTPASGGARSTSRSPTTARCSSPTTAAARSGASLIRGDRRRRPPLPIHPRFICPDANSLRGPLGTFTGVRRDRAGHMNSRFLAAAAALGLMAFIGSDSLIGGGPIADHPVALPRRRGLRRLVPRPCSRTGRRRRTSSGAQLTSLGAAATFKLPPANMNMPPLVDPKNVYASIAASEHQPGDRWRAQSRLCAQPHHRQGRRHRP